MKKVKLFVYNYGTITQIADFKSNSHDGIICLTHLNDRLITAHGYLPEDIFYYLEWYGKHNNKHIYIDYTGHNFAHSLPQSTKIKLHEFTHNNIICA